MALVIEDGTGKADATSFVTFAETRAYASARGFTLPDDDVELEILITNSIDYIQIYENEYDGERLTAIQALPFPRTGGYINGVLVPDGVIPPQVKSLQNGTIITLNQGVVLFPTTSERAIKRKQVGPLETEWFDANLTPTTSYIDVLLAPLLSSYSQFALTVRRI